MFPLLRLLVCAGALASLTLAMACSTGCGQSGLPRGSVKGRVTIGGQPMASGRVLFLPTNGPTVSAVVANGEYQLPRSEGPVAGANRVEVEADRSLGFAIDDEAAFARRGGRPLPPNPVPPNFNRSSKLSIEIKSGEDHSLDITIPAAGHTAAATW